MHGEGPNSGAASVETLRLAYDEAQKQLDIMRQMTRDLYVELLGLPASLGVIVTLLIAFRPEEAETWVGVLYGFGLLPFGWIVWVSVKSALDLLLPAESEAIAKDSAARSYQEFTEGVPNDGLPEREWLQRKLTGLRATHFAMLTFVGPYRGLARRLRIMLVANLLYFLGLTIVVPLVS